MLVAPSESKKQVGYSKNEYTDKWAKQFRNLYSAYNGGIGEKNTFAYKMRLSPL